MDEDTYGLSRPIHWIIVSSASATVLYTTTFSMVRKPTPLHGSWILAVIMSIFFNWASAYCDKQGGAFNQFASYVAGLVGLATNIAFAAFGCAVILGPKSSLYHWAFAPR
jgi:hypothetical protein